MHREKSGRAAWRNTAMLGIAALVLLAIVGVSYREWRRYSRANIEASRTKDIIDFVDRLRVDLVEAETGQRGFLLTGENRYLEPYNKAAQSIPGDLARLKDLLAARPDEAGNDARLQNLVNGKLAELRATIELRRSQGATPALAIVLSDRGKRTMDEIRAVCADIQRREVSIQAQPSAAGEAAAGTALLATTAGALLLLFLFAFGLEPFASPEPQAWQRSWPVTYGAAVLAVVTIALLRGALTPLIGRTNLPFTLFFAAVAFTAWFGGFRPTVLSLALSILAGDWFFAAPTRTLLVSGRDDQIAVLLMIVVGFGMALLSRAQRSAVERAMLAENSERNERQRFETTLASIGDAVIATDAEGRITFANRIAQDLMGWRAAEIQGKHLDGVFRILNEITRASVESPVARVLREGAIVWLANHTVLIARDGTEVPVDDSAAPIRDAAGAMQGTVLVFRDVTARRRAEQLQAQAQKEIADQRERLRITLSSIGDAVMTTDTAGRVAYLNPVAEQLTGWTTGEAAERPLEDVFRIVNENTRKPAENPVTRVLREGRIVSLANHTTLLSRNGTEISIDDSAAPIRDASGEMAGVVLVFRDVTAQRKAQQIAAQAQKTFVDLVEQAPFGVYIVDSQFRIAQMNRGSQNAAFRNVRPLIGRDLAEAMRILWPEPVAAAIIAAFRHTLQTGEAYYSPRFTNPREDVGTVESYEWELHRITLADGQHAVVCYYYDSTQLRQTEQALRDSHLQLAIRAKRLTAQAKLLDLASNAIFVRDAANRITYWNKGAENLYGWAQETALGKNPHELLQTKFPQPLEEIVDLLGNEGRWDGELIHTCRNGAKVTVLSRWVLVQGEDSERSVMEVNTDITERKQLEEHRAELLAKERALAFEAALRKAEAELARVTRALSVEQLAASIAHEVNQPLAGVVTNAEAGMRWLSADPPNLQETKDSLAMVVRDGNRASAIIRRIRSFLSKKPPATAPFDINDVVREVIDLSRTEFIKRQIGVLVELSPSPASVRGDRVQLQQVILNLMMNGAEAMTSSDEPRELLVTSRAAPEGNVVVAVRDSGAGISPQDLPRMFEAFFTTKETGMGLGLSISRSIVEAHGGRIWAERNEGRGLTIRFSLPAGSPEQEPSATRGES